MEKKFKAWDKEEKRFWTQKEMIEIGGYYYTWGLGNYNGRFILMQYTGLKDKNGKEIYEGDIAYMYLKNRAIVWEGYKYNINIEEAGLIEVIGNIYQNKELLK